MTVSWRGVGILGHAELLPPEAGAVVDETVREAAARVAARPPEPSAFLWEGLPDALRVRLPIVRWATGDAIARFDGAPGVVWRVPRRYLEHLTREDVYLLPFPSLDEVYVSDHERLGPWLVPLTDPERTRLRALFGESGAGGG